MVLLVPSSWRRACAVVGACVVVTGSTPGLAALAPSARSSYDVHSI